LSRKHLVVSVVILGFSVGFPTTPSDLQGAAGTPAGVDYVIRSVGDTVRVSSALSDDYASVGVATKANAPAPPDAHDDVSSEVALYYSSPWPVGATEEPKLDTAKCVQPIGQTDAASAASNASTEDANLSLPSPDEAKGELDVAKSAQPIRQASLATVASEPATTPARANGPRGRLSAMKVTGCAQCGADVARQWSAGSLRRLSWSQKLLLKGQPTKRATAQGGESRDRGTRILTASALSIFRGEPKL